MKKTKNSKKQKRRQVAAGKPASQAAEGRLRFPPGEVCGMTPISLSVGKNNPPAIVREILQNSLDAAKQAGRQCARVLFSLESVEGDKIPGIAQYKNALEKCGEFCRTRTKHSQAMPIIDGIRRRLEQKFLPALFVCDNGIGLDGSRMQAILSDGVSDQSSAGATGSHGNGHFTAFNLSGLRYLLYGGVSTESGRLASGHAMLCSHEDGKAACGKNGYFVARVNDSLFDRFTFPSDGDIPSIIARKLDEMEETGTVLAVMDFNFFGEDEQHVADLITGAAARNFFVAVAKGELVVTVKTEGGEQTLKASNLRETMEKISPTIPNTRNFPKHETSQRFYNLFDDAAKQTGGVESCLVKREGGSMQVLYRQQMASTKIALCRNGMWITDSVPWVRSGDFGDYAAFEALLLCDASDSSGKLVRKAEGNLHNELKLNDIADKKERETLRGIFQDIRRRLKEVIEKQDAESISFVSVDGAGRISISETAGRITPSKERIRPIGEEEEDPVGGDKAKKEASQKAKRPGTTKPKAGRALSVQHSAVRQGGKMNIRIVAMESSPEVELRLVRSGGGDFSCDNPREGDEMIHLRRVVCGNEECDVAHGVARIGAVSEGDEKAVMVEFDAPKLCRVDYEFIRRSPSPPPSS